MLIRLLGAIQRYFGVLARLQEKSLPFIIKVMVHRREKLTPGEQAAMKKTLESLNITLRKTTKPVIVALVGLVGSGKSSVARKLAQFIGAAVVEGDTIRVFLRKERETYNKARKIAEDAGVAIIRDLGSNVIFDSDHIDPAKRASLRAKAKEAGVELIFIRTYTDSSDNPKIPGYNLDEMIGRNMVAPHHYRWVNKTGGRLILRKLPFKVFAEINTANQNWEAEVRNVATKIIKKF